MIKILTILTAIFFLASCKTPQVVIRLVTKDSVILKDTTIYKTVTKYLPGDSVEISVAIPCPDAKFDTTVKKGKTSLTATIKNGRLAIDCKTDSLQHIIDSVTRLKNKEVYHTEVKEVPVNVPTPYIPKWVWWLLVVNVGAVAYKFRYPLIGMFK